ncbi:hypothetical protein J6590_046532 [Homalodisca vitripennis]|nr:hypothetical protein J6590_046532 [Homalodisca vitripennis]
MVAHSPGKWEIRVRVPAEQSKGETGPRRASPPVLIALREPLPIDRTRMRSNGQEEKVILKNVNGRFRPFKVSAILGPSGAGKTSLLNILTCNRCCEWDNVVNEEVVGVREEGVAGRDGARSNIFPGDHQSCVRPWLGLVFRIDRWAGVQGNVTVNGQSWNRSQFRRLCCYITQEFAMMELLTVRETLQIAANLKLPGKIWCAKRKVQKIKLMRSSSCLLILKKEQKTQVRYLSGGEKKRLSIGVELITNPPVMFFDEPTSGLDSSASLMVMEHLQSLAQTGITVVVVIHQLSFQCFQYCDDVLLLSCGRSLFNGPANTLADTFATLGYHCPPFFNIAEFAVEVANMKPDQVKHLVDNAQEFYRGRSGDFFSELARRSLKGVGDDPTSEMSPMLIGEDKHHKITIQRQSSSNIQGYPISTFAQFCILFKRCTLCINRDLSKQLSTLEDLNLVMAQVSQHLPYQTLIRWCDAIRWAGVQGNVTVNGQSWNRSQFRRLCCYITQEFAMMELLTVRETLQIAANLKLPGKIWCAKRKVQIEDKVDEILELLILKKEQKTQVRYLSGGEKKRLSIGVELITNPPVMFFDEPTSGLDSSASLMVMEHLQSLAQTGITVVVVIHQPSSRCFQYCDDVLLLSCGRSLFNGPANTLADTFATLGYHCPPFFNIAEFAVEVANMKPDQVKHLVDNAQEFYRGRSGDFFSELARRSLKGVGDDPTSEMSASHVDRRRQASQNHHPKTKFLQHSRLPNLHIRSVLHLKNTQKNNTQNTTKHPTQTTHTHTQKPHVDKKTSITKSPSKDKFSTFKVTNLHIRSEKTSITKSPSKDKVPPTFKVTRSPHSLSSEKTSITKSPSKDIVPPTFKVTQSPHSLSSEKTSITKSPSKDIVPPTFKVTQSPHSPVLYILYLYYSRGQSHVDRRRQASQNTTKTPHTNPPTPTTKKKITIQRQSSSNIQGYPISTFAQFCILFKRCTLCINRDLQLSRVRLTTHAVVSLLLGILFYNFGTDASKVYGNFSFIFFNVLFVFFATSMPTICTFPKEADVFLREQSNNWYPIRAYYFAKILADLPLQILCPTIFVAVGWYMTGQPLVLYRFGMLWLVSVLVAVLAQTIGNACGAALTVETALFIVPSSTIPVLLLSGFFVTMKDLYAPFQVLAEFSYFKFAFEAACQSVFGYDRPKLACSQPYCHYKQLSKFLHDIGMSDFTFWHNIVCLATWIFVMQLFLYILLRWRVSQAKV